MSNEEQAPPQQQFWQSTKEAARWAQQSQVRQNTFGAVTQLMLEAAALGPGDHVLDLAAGTGDQSLLAARKIGPTGTVLATDISAAMLKEAARSAEREGLTTITTQVMNAEQLELADQSFDAVICRLGLMALVHQQEALQGILRVLKPGRKLAALVWSTPESHPLFSLPQKIVAKYVAETTLTPNVFSLGGPGVFERALKEANFRAVGVQAIPFQFSFPSMDAYLQQIPNNPVTSVVNQLSQQDQQRVQEEIRQAVSKFEGPEGLVFPSELLLGVGTH